MVRRWVVPIFLFVLATIPVAAGGAQGEDDACPVFTAMALEQVGEACDGLGRNETCYGNPQLEMTFREVSANLRFAQPADRVPVRVVDTLHTSAMDLRRGVWGVSVMRIQADLPDTRPGEVVTFLLFGDVMLQNAGAEAQPPVAEPCAATTRADVQGRQGPGRDHAAAVALAAGESIRVTGRNPDGAWLRAESGGEIVWLPVDAVDSACDLAPLPTYDADGPTVYGPMQAFYFVSGLGEVLCQEAPPSALVVQSPSGEHVTISANGVSVTLGSTVALQAVPNGAMRLVTLQGEATARAAGAQVVVPAGFQTTVPLGGADGLEPQGPPEPVELADLGAFEALLQTPAALLSEVIVFPEPEAVEAHVTALCGDAVCQGFEDAASCPADCTSAVCNGVCDGTDCIDCPSDCRADQCYWCGNGTCDPIEDAASCPADCTGGDDDDGDDSDNLARLCGDGVCQGHESAETCPVDCAGGGRLCGDGVCQGHESAETCPVDCGGGGRLCGDGVCQGHESAETCPADCD